MSVGVKNQCQTPLSPKIERLIQELLRKVPQEHLAGLETIVLVDQVTHKRSRRQGVRGLYWPASQKRPATIELAPSLIYHGMPKFLLHMPFFAKFALANILYHEIGHHYHHRFAHGVTEEKSQSFADNYQHQMLKKAFFWWLLIVLPLWRVVRRFRGKRRQLGKRGKSVRLA